MSDTTIAAQGKSPEPELVSGGSPADAAEPRARSSWPRFILAKAVGALVSMIMVVVVGFFAFRILPGDPVRMLAQDRRTTPEQLEALRVEYGLDQPLIAQFWRYLTDLVQGDLGTSLVFRQPVIDLIGERLWPTILLTGTASLIAVVIGLAIGQRAAWRRGRAFDNVNMGIALTLWSVPTFWLGLLLIMVFGGMLGWFPTGGMTSPGSSANGFAHVLDVLHHLALPAIALGAVSYAHYLLVMRASLLEELPKDYLQTARAKGLKEDLVRTRHVLRLLPKNAKVDGKVLLNGELVTEMTWGRMRIVRWTEAAVVFQGAMHALNPVRRIREQIEEALELHATGDRADMASPAKREARVAEFLEMVDLPTSKGAAFPHQLSGGQKQRVMIAMALACEPDVIIADEPTTALDVIVQDQILQLLKRRVAERDLTLMMISHDLTVLATVCEEIAVMYRGELIEHGPSHEVLANPKHPHTAKLAAAFPLIGDPSSRLALPAYTAPDAPTADPDAPRPPRPPRVQAARDLADVATQRLDLSDVVLAARDLTVEFGHGPSKHVAVDHVDLTCRPGEIIALVGQSGSGTTTLARTLLGLQAPTSGEVLYRSEPLSQRQRGLKRYRRQVQYGLQDPMAALNTRHTVYEQIAEGLRIQGIRGDERALVAQALRDAELDPEEFFHAYPNELSGGQRQRVVIAGALALDPEFLIADEPVASLDASVRADVLALFLRLRSERGLGALIITHDLGLAWNIADRVAVMYRGEIVEHGPVEEVLLHPSHDYTKQLLAVVPSAETGHADRAEAKGRS